MTCRIAKIALTISTALYAIPAIAHAADSNGEGDSNVIIVTAQKRAQTLIEVPQSIAVLGGDTLERQQVTGIADFAAKVPGLAIQQGNPGQSQIVLRGITTGSASPTVAVYVDDTPFGGSTGLANAGVLAGDFDTFDLDRIEVLRGPQGTLYGANSLGGVIRYITATPKLGRLEAKAQAGVAAVTGGDINWNGTAVVNVPLGDRVALRTSGFYRRLGGFIDAPSRGASDVNRSDSYGGRASLLIEPSDRFSVRFSALLQNLRSDSRAAYDADPVTYEPVFADPFTGAPLRGLTRTEFSLERVDIDYRLYNATADIDLGFATLTSVTSLGDLKQVDDSDASYLPAGPGVTLGDAVTGIYGSMVPLGVNYNNQLSTRKFTQELRLTSPDNDSVEWVLGGYFTREKGKIFQRYFPYDQATGSILPPAVAGFDNLVLAQLDSVYKEYAAFGSLTWHVSDRFDITAGGRYSHNSQDTLQVLDGALVGGRQELEGRSTENVFTWSVSPRFEVGDHSAIYARVAKGFRPGGPNAVPPGAGPNFPTSFRSDTLINYELGFRGETSDRSFAWDASVYYIDWKDIQIGVVVDTDIGPVNVDGNGGKAESYGVELSGTLRPVRGLTAVATLGYNKATLKDDTGTGGFKGDLLPLAPQFSASFDVDYEWNLGDDTTAFVGGTAAMISDRVLRFDSEYQATYNRRPTVDGYGTVDLRAGVNFGRVSLSAYVRNLANTRGLVNAGLIGVRPGNAAEAYPIRPRTLGAIFGVTF
jgi:iron complex outermembrane recepter protein